MEKERYWIEIYNLKARHYKEFYFKFSFLTLSSMKIWAKFLKVIIFLFAHQGYSFGPRFGVGSFNELTYGRGGKKLLQSASLNARKKSTSRSDLSTPCLNGLVSVFCFPSGEYSWVFWIGYITRVTFLYAGESLSCFWSQLYTNASSSNLFCSNSNLYICRKKEEEELIYMDVRKTQQHTKYQWAKYKGTSNLCYQPVDGGGQMKTYLP